MAAIDPSQPHASPEKGPDHLKRVSRIKHIILEKYLPSWATILGSRFTRLAYVDCFAGPGEYEFQGQRVEGSAVIAAREAIHFAEAHRQHDLAIYLIDDDRQQIDRLETRLRGLQPYPRNLVVETVCNDSRSFIPSLLGKLGPRVPIFFLIDPYGHPLPLPIIRGILKRDRTEVLINLMWFQINRDLNNPIVEVRLNDLFGDTDWQHQPFMNMRGPERERQFVAYFKSKLGCNYTKEFKIRHDVEDSQGSGRTKYYLLHGSNHVKAPLLMKEVMWHLGDEKGTFDFSGETHPVLISETPPESELRDLLLRKFAGKEMTFDELREETWAEPFIEKNYRSVLRALEGKGVTIIRVSSTRTGISKSDRIRFAS